MNKTKMLMLIAPAALLLAGCGDSEPGSDYKEIDATAAKKQIAAIQENVDKADFAVPTKATISTYLKMVEDETSNEMNAKVAYDLSDDGPYFYFGTSETETNEGSDSVTNSIKGWLYKKDNQYVMAAESGETKVYATADVDSEKGEEVKKNIESSLSDYSASTDSIKESIKTTLTQISAYITMSEGAAALSMSGVGNLNIKLFGKGDGDLKVTIESTETHTVSSESVSFQTKATMVFANYLPVLAETEVTASTGASMVMKYTYDWNKVEKVYPDLSQLSSTSWDD